MIVINNECVVKFMELLNKQHRYIIYKIDVEKKEVLVENIGERSTSYDDFEANLPLDECRYALFEYDIPNPEEDSPSSQIFFISWSPDTSEVKSKMMYAAWRSSIEMVVEGAAGHIKYKLHVTDPIVMKNQIIEKSRTKGA